MKDNNKIKFLEWNKLFHWSICLSLWSNYAICRPIFRFVNIWKRLKMKIYVRVPSCSLLLPIEAKRGRAISDHNQTLHSFLLVFPIIQLKDESPKGQLNLPKVSKLWVWLARRIRKVLFAFRATRSLQVWLLKQTESETKPKRNCKPTYQARERHKASSDAGTFVIA